MPTRNTPTGNAGEHAQQLPTTGPLATAIATLIDQLRTDLRAKLLTELHAHQTAASWPEWMNIDTAARYLDVSPQRLRKLQARHAIPYYQEAPGCRVLFRRTDLDNWMAGFHHAAKQTT